MNDRYITVRILRSKKCEAKGAAAKENITMEEWIMEAIDEKIARDAVKE